MHITQFDFQIKTENIMRAADCRPDSPVYPFVLAEYEKYKDTAEAAISLSAWIEFDESKRLCYVLITAGEAISTLSTELFANGNAMAGILVSAIGDEALFQADKIISEKIKVLCAAKKLGIQKRLEAPIDFPLERQQEMIAATGAPITLTEGFQFSPPKTMGYLLEITDNRSIFNAQHDCSRCPIKNCSRRTRDFQDSEFDILSDSNTPTSPISGNVLCIDIGTTTVVGTFFKNGVEAGSFRTVNPQRRFGADVLSRIEAAERGRLKELRQLIVFDLLKETESLCKDQLPDQILIAANTTMAHLLMGWSCSGLGKYPFSPHSLETIHCSLKDLGGKTEIPVTILGGISAFVGGDIVSGIYACEMAKHPKISLFVDLGTNGEIALGNQEKILVTSTAAGPAFEGGGISCGTGSVKGAICGVDLHTQTLTTIGNSTPIGLCGTGIIELVSELLDAGIADRTGLLCAPYFEQGYPVTEQISFTQKDMREVQTAKSAVLSGIATLLHEYGISMNEVETVYLAGGFGYGLNLMKAEKIGLLPHGTSQKAQILGNSALGGVLKYASDPNADHEIEHIKAISTDIVLGQNEYFAKQYIENINFV